MNFHPPPTKNSLKMLLLHFLFFFFVSLSEIFWLFLVAYTFYRLETLLRIQFFIYVFVPQDTLEIKFLLLKLRRILQEVKSFKIFISWANGAHRVPAGPCMSFIDFFFLMQLNLGLLSGLQQIIYFIKI